MIDIRKAKSQKKLNEKHQIEQRKEEKVENPDPNLIAAIEAARKNKEDRSVNTDTMTINENENAIVKTVPIDYEPTRIEISNYPNSNKHDKATQSPHRERKLLNKGNKADVNGQRKNSQISDENFFGQYRPPALVFNSELDRQQQNNNGVIDSNKIVNEIKTKQTYLNFRMEYLTLAVQNQEFIEGDS